MYLLGNTREISKPTMKRMSAPTRRSKRLKLIDEEPLASTENDKLKNKKKGGIGRQAFLNVENNISMKEAVKVEESEMERSQPEDNYAISKSQNQHSESDSSDGDEDELHEYKTLRLRNLQENKEFLAQLGMNQAKADFKEVSMSTKKRQAVSRGYKEKTERKVLPRRAPSLRLQRKDPDGQEVPYVLPADEVKWTEPERPGGPLDFIDVLKNKEDIKEAGETFIGHLKKIEPNHNRPQPIASNIKTYTKELNKLQLCEKTVAKVCPNRIFSMAFHPTTDKKLLAAGDKWGNVGFWDVTSANGQDGVICFQPHVRPVSTLAFSHFNSSHMYTCSYDGSLRCGDLNKAIFDEVYVYPDEDSNVSAVGFDFTSPDTLIASTTDGHVVFIDRRSDSKSGEFDCLVHPKKRVRTVSVHPVQSQYFATASTDSTVKIWDSRSMSNKNKAVPVCTLTQGKMVNSAYFSSVTGNKLLTTSMDNTLRIYDSSTINGRICETRNISHFNNTGRWLSKFNATWHPARDDIFVVGSMSRPRQVEVFSTGSLVKVYQNEDWLGSVCSVNAFHPSMDVLAGANSSGRVHVFM